MLLQDCTGQPHGECAQIELTVVCVSQSLWLLLSRLLIMERGEQRIQKHTKVDKLNMLQFTLFWNKEVYFIFCRLSSSYFFGKLAYSFFQKL